MPIPEDSKTLAEFYPDCKLRQKLHYEFAHRFLVKYVHHNPFNFILHDGAGPTRFIQARWCMMENMAGLQSGKSFADGSIVFRRVTDLEAWTQDVAGHPGVFIQMPVPELYCCAFFVAAVLLAPTDSFRAVEQSLSQQAAGDGQPPSESHLATCRAARARIFTLERSINYEGAEALQVGRLCEWTAAAQHLNSGLAVPVSREDLQPRSKQRPGRGRKFQQWPAIRQVLELRGPPSRSWHFRILRHRCHRRPLNQKGIGGDFGKNAG